MIAVSKKYFFLFMVILLTIPFLGYSQSLLKFSDQLYRHLDQQKILWSVCEESDCFVLVLDFKDLGISPTAYTILDNHVETGQFYWLFRDPFLAGDWMAVEKGIQGKLLWHNENYGIARFKTNWQAATIPPGFRKQKIYFNRALVPAASLDKGLRLPDLVNQDVLHAVADSVNIDSLYVTERDLTGITSFFLNGVADSIKSRYSLNPQIFIAQDYLKMRLEKLGYTVELDPFAMPATYYDIQFTEGQADTGWISGEDRIFATTDGGNSWTMQYRGSQGSALWALSSPNSRTVYAVGGDGKILKTSDAGASWITQASPTTEFLYGVTFLDENNGWIAGDLGIIMKTTDGGVNWNIKTTPSTYRLYSIFFTDLMNGWAVGLDGLILHTADGGESWQFQNSGTANWLDGVFFCNPDTGFAVGWYGTVVKTTDGGANWSVITVPLSDTFSDIDFIDSQNGIVVGRNGSALYTTDGGNSWQVGGNLFNRYAYAVDMVSPSSIWTSGIALLARSTDGGVSWQSQLQNLPDFFLNNIIATKTGSTYPDQYFILCAHYDDMPGGSVAPGADDNGSGTSAVIEAARVLKNYDFNYSIRFILFAGEEQGLVGSASYASNAAASGMRIPGVINMDMIGYDGDDDGRMEIHAGTLTSSQAIGTVVQDNIAFLGLPLVADFKTGTASGASDHRSFWTSGYPAIMLIEDFEDFTPYYHTIDDRLSTLRSSFFHNNARLAIASLANLAEIQGSSVGIADRLIPQVFEISDPYPNPFNPSVNLEYHLTHETQVTVTIFDLLGRKITELFKGHQFAGKYRLNWNGKDKSGKPVSSGIYLIRFKNQREELTKKVVLMR
jgi:photosystem II stability/assembly factor-like uncharacterized protein